MPDRYALVRPDFGGTEAGDSGRVMPTVVSGDYELIQHRDFVSILDPLAAHWQAASGGFRETGAPPSR